MKLKEILKKQGEIYKNLTINKTIKKYNNTIEKEVLCKNMSKKINLELTLDNNPLFLEGFTGEEKSKIIEEFNKRTKNNFYIVADKKGKIYIKKGHEKKVETMNVPLDGVVLIKRTYNKKNPYNFLSSYFFRTHIHMPDHEPLYIEINC